MGGKKKRVCTCLVDRHSVVHFDLLRTRIPLPAALEGRGGRESQRVRESESQRVRESERVSLSLSLSLCVCVCMCHAYPVALPCTKPSGATQPIQLYPMYAAAKRERERGGEGGGGGGERERERVRERESEGGERVCVRGEGGRARAGGGNHINHNDLGRARERTLWSKVSRLRHKSI